MLENITLNNPCGDDIKYDDTYIAIETEVEKNFNVSNTGETKWDVVINKCENLLAHQSKDLKLLSYWLYAQKKLNGWDAFLKSFDIYIKLLTQYNKDLFPKSEKRKIKILEWLETILEDDILKSLDNFSKEQLTYLVSLYRSFETVIPRTISTTDTFFKDTQKKSSHLLTQIDNKLNEEEKLKAIQVEELLKQKEEERILNEAQTLRRSEEEETLAKFSSSHTTEIINETMQLTASDIDDCITSITDISTALLKKAPADYFSYKLLFSLGEMLIEESFINTNSNHTDLLPSDDIIYAVRSLENNKVSIRQLNALIEQLLIRPSWIEGYYIVSTILYKLSRKEDATKLENMLFTFLYKEEEMLNTLKMIPKTMNDWFQTKILSLNDNSDSAIEYQVAYHEILQVKNEQNEQNALLLLEDYYQKAKDQESRFRWKLLFVEFALEIGDKKVALSLLLELEKLIEIHGIDKWKPDLAITTYETFLKPILTQEIKDELKDRIYDKLSILDVKKVIKLH